MTHSADKLANARKNGGAAKKLAEQTMRPINWDTAIAHLKAMLDHHERQR